jgi:hypothetical protein
VKLWWRLCDSAVRLLSQPWLCRHIQVYRDRQ